MQFVNNYPAAVEWGIIGIIKGAINKPPLFLIIKKITAYTSCISQLFSDNS